MRLVILAAGRGQRFGGLKQVAPVGPNGEAIMDYTAAGALACGYDGIVLVIRREIDAEIRAHVERHFPAGIPVAFAYQGARRGTAEAVATAASAVDGPFAVANADDLYGSDALATVAAHFAATAPQDPRHLLVGYELVRTVLTDDPVTRGLVEVSPSGSLAAIVEHTVTLRADGRFDAVPLGGGAPSSVLAGDELVSMNLWGFHPRLFDALGEALSRRRPDEARELLLPDVVGELVARNRDVVAVARTSQRCIGITHAEDLALVQDELAITANPLRAPRPV